MLNKDTQCQGCGKVIDIKESIGKSYPLLCSGVCLVTYYQRVEIKRLRKSLTRLQFIVIQQTQNPNAVRSLPTRGRWPGRRKRRDSPRKEWG